MSNVIYKEGPIQVQVTFLGIYEEKVYVVLKMQNDGGRDYTFTNNNSYSSKPKYYSKQLGIRSFLGLIPSSEVYHEIRAGYFLEIQAVFDCPVICEGDEFSLHGNFNISYRSIRFDFKYHDECWMVTTTIAATKEHGEESYQTILEFPKAAKRDTPAAIEHPFEVLDSLIGLSGVKEEVLTLSNFIKIQKMREEKGMKASAISYHCVFTGNPGTGKTTVARIVAAIYKDLGILKKGHLVETDRSGLVAGYVGQTAIKTNAVIDSALDGVLFIDEAYALAGNYDSGNDFGGEAIATLLKRMEDDRDRLVVIIAGYSKEMKDFINANSGLKSRFVRYIDFADYSPAELLDIFKLNATEGGYQLGEDSIVVLKEAFEKVIAANDRNYGNGRYVRNVFEESLKAQANRLATNPTPSESDLEMLTVEDVRAGIDKATIRDAA